MIHHHLSGQGDGIFITRSNQILGQKSRYRPRATSGPCGNHCPEAPREPRRT
jgi:hypothetical protein